MHLFFQALDGEENDAVVKGKHPGQIAALSKQLKSSRLLEPSSDIDQKSATCDLAGSTASNVNLPTKQSRRKMHLKKTMSQQEMKSLENGLHNQSSKYSTNQQCSTHHIKVEFTASSFFRNFSCLIYKIMLTFFSSVLQKKVSCSLSSYKARRWCTFEWFYSAIDYPWFTKKEFVEYLDHVGLGHILRLSRVEWGVIRRYCFSCCCHIYLQLWFWTVTYCIWYFLFLVDAVRLEGLVGFLNTSYMKKERNLNNIGNLLGNIILRFVLVLEKDSHKIYHDLYQLDNE